MRSFVLLGSMLQSSSLVKADCTLQDGTVQIGARKFSEISPRNIPYPSPKPPKNQLLIFTLESTTNFTPTSNYYPRLMPEISPVTVVYIYSTSCMTRNETISSFLG